MPGRVNSPRLTTAELCASIAGVDVTLALRLAFAFNILVLVPVVAMLLRGPAGTAAVFQGTVTDSPGMRALLAALWSSILICSLAGLWQPRLFAPLLAVQVIYKALWLGFYVLPLWRAGAAIPAGVAVVFLFIVLVWPIILWLTWRTV